MTNKELMQEYVTGRIAGEGSNCYILGCRLYTYHEVLCEWKCLNSKGIEFRLNMKRYSKTSSTHRNLLIHTLEAEGYTLFSNENNIALYRKES
jgi:hypothetical protein